MYIDIQGSGGSGLGAVRSGAPFPWPVRPRGFKPRTRGMGATPSTGAIITTGAGTALTTGLSTKSTVAGAIAGGLATAALFDPEPISKAILAISAAFVGPMTALVNRGCGQTCIVASKAADDATAAAEQIKQQYWGTPVPRPRSLQQAALSALKQIADTLQAACSNPTLGDAGKRCISERLVEGGSAPWCPNGGCDYWTTYYRPIEKDPNVVDASPLSAAANALGLPSDVSLPAGLSKSLLPAALAAAVFWFLE